MRSASSCNTAGAEACSVARPSPCGRLASRTIGSLITPGFGGHELSRPQRVSWLPVYGMMEATSIPVSCGGVKRTSQTVPSLTLLVNPLRNPPAANLFSIKYYKKHLCIPKWTNSPKHGRRLLAQWMALRGWVILALRSRILVIPGGTP